MEHTQEGTRLKHSERNLTLPYEVAKMRGIIKLRAGIQSSGVQE